MVKATPRIPSECGAETIILRPWLESWPASCWPGCLDIYIYIYIYIKRGVSQVCSVSGWPLLGTLHHTFLLHCASSGGRTALSSNSIKQHRVPAWPVGRLMESQHGLLVVQGSISMACWSSQPSVPQHTQHSRGRTGRAACGSAQAPQASSGSPPRWGGCYHLR